MHRKTVCAESLCRLYILAIVIVSLCISLLILSQSQRLAVLDTSVPFESPELLGIRVAADNHSRNNAEPDPEVRARRLPHAIVIGTRKSGTRALLRFLEVNPSIKFASKEVHFFDRQANYRKGLEWYKQQMPETTKREITLEKSPAYFVTKGVPERVKAMNSSVKLIVIFRNPVTRLISDYSQLIANRLETAIDETKHVDGWPGGGLSDDPFAWQKAGLEFEEHVLRPDGRIDERRRMVRTGMYSVHLEKWLAVFPRDQFLFVDGERLIVEPHVELQKLERFLGVEASIEKKHFVFNSRKGFYCLARANSTTSANVGKLAKRLAGGQICLSKSKGRQHVAVSDVLKRKLADFYAPYNEYLFSITDIKLN